MVVLPGHTAEDEPSTAWSFQRSVNRDQPSRRSVPLFFRLTDPGEEGNRIFRNVRIYLPADTASVPEDMNIHQHPVISCIVPYKKDHFVNEPT
jgi:hypothetical protein